MEHIETSEALPAMAKPEVGDEQPTPQPGVFRARVVPGIALAMVLGLVALLVYSLAAPDSGRLGSQAGRVNSSGALITEGGRKAPEFSGELFDGGRFSLAQQSGKIVVINFWASWCPPCQDETPLLTTAYGQLGDDVVLIGVDVWDKRDDAEGFVDFYDVNYPILQDASGTIAVDYGLTGVPETFVVDKSGHIIARLPGPVQSIQQLRDMIAAAR